ncbi:MAG TPA: hypothetical protein QF520_11325, partial [SAR202 cluster bacterium]|nr:hypothetical protein [SAR202 cluster bacterium]
RFLSSVFSITAAPSLGTFYPPVRSSLYLPTVSINFRPKCVPFSLTVYKRMPIRITEGLLFTITDE